MTAGCSQQAIIGPLTSWVVGQQIKVQDRKTWKQNELVWSRLLTEATNWYSFVQERKKQREKERALWKLKSYHLRLRRRLEIARFRRYLAIFTLRVEVKRLEE